MLLSNVWRARFLILPVPLLLLLTSCATIQSGAFTPNKASAERAFDEVKNRAAFDLGCQREKLELVVLGVDKGWFGTDIPTQIGTSGCGHKGVYVSTPSGWVLNGEGPQAK